MSGLPESGHGWATDNGRFFVHLRLLALAPPALGERRHRRLAASGSVILGIFGILPQPFRRFLAGDEPT